MKLNTIILSSLLLFVFLISDSYISSSIQLKVQGIVTHNGRTLNGAVINILSGSKIHSQVVSRRNGKFDFDLNYGEDYIIEVSKEGFITRRIIISTRIDKDIIKAGGITEGFFDLQIQMIEMVPGLNISVFNQPVKKYVFDRNSWLFNSDEEFENKTRSEIEKIIKQLGVLKQKEYKRQLKLADSLMNSSNYEDAWITYDNALQYFPDESYPKTQIKKINKIIKAEASTEADYRNSIEKGDYYYSNENFKLAATFYKKALLYKPDELYPATKINDIDSIFTRIFIEKKQAYDSFISLADKFLRYGDYKNAQLNFNKAQVIFPDEQYPKIKIHEINNLIIEAKKEENEKLQKEKEQEKNTEYNNLIKQADDLLVQKKYEEAKKLLKRSLTIKPNEKYPERKIKEIDIILASLKEEKQLLAERANENNGPSDSININEDSKEKISKYKKTLKDKEEEGDKAGTSAILSEIGNLYHNNNELGKAIEYYNKSLDLKRETGDLEGASIILNDIAVAYYDSGKYETAVDNYKESYRINEELGNKKVSAVILDNIGQVYENTYQFENAVKFYEQSLDIVKDIENKEEEAIIHDKIANVYFEQNNLGKAIESYQKSMEIDKELNKEENVAATLNNIGSAYYNLGKFDDAKNYYEQSLNVTMKIGDSKQVSIALNNIGNINYNWNKYRKAIDYYKQSIEIKQGIDYKRGIAASLHNIGNAYKGLKEYLQAIEYYSKSNDLADKIDYTEVVARNNRAFAEVYSLLNDYKKAYEYQKLFADSKHTISDEKIQIFEGAAKERRDDKRILIASLRRQIQKQKLLAEYEANRRQKELEIKNLELTNEREKTKRQSLIIFAGIIGLIALIVFTCLVYRQYIQKKKKNIELVEKNRVISYQKQQITDSIQYASRIQKAVLPPEEYVTRILPQHFILNKPRDIVSGDYYWTTQRGNESIIAVADCTGHGVPGAFMSMLGIAFLNEIVNKNATAKSHEILEQLRVNVMSSLHQTGKEDEAKDGMDIALIIIDLESNSLQYSGAHNSLHIVRKNKLQEVKADKMPIGISVRYDKPFSVHKIQLNKNDMLYIFSDGYLDQFGGEHRKKFGIRRFRELLLEIHHKPVDEQRDILDKTFAAWMGNYDQIDDIMVMGIRI